MNIDFHLLFSKLNFNTLEMKQFSDSAVLTVSKFVEKWPGPRGWQLLPAELLGASGGGCGDGLGDSEMWRASEGHRSAAPHAAGEAQDTELLPGGSQNKACDD